MTDKTDSKERDVAEQWLRDRYGAYRGHFAWRELEEAFLAGRASLTVSAGSGPLMGQPQAMPDLTKLTERGAKAWAGVDAQGLREGFTAADMATASAQGFRDGVASIAACAGSESVAADGWLHENGLLYRLTDERDPRNRDEINVTMADGSRSIESRSRRALELLDRIRATHPSPPEGMAGGWIASKDQMPPPGVRVFWGDVDSHRVGYDSWAGDDYRWAPSHWMHIPEFPTPPTTSAGSGKGEA